MSSVKRTVFVVPPGLRRQKIMAHAVSRSLNKRTGRAVRVVARQRLRHARLPPGRAGTSIRFEERVRERERIARELHDTLLQGTQALLLMVQTLSIRMQPDDPMRGMLTGTLLRAEALMAQGRDRIQNLRSVPGAAVDLAQHLANAWRDLGGEREFRILVEGQSRELEPDAGDEIALIAREALTNALLHSRAKAIEAQVVFEADQLRLFVRDNGVGLGQDVLGPPSLAGRWGLAGMRERAQSIFASLAISSAPGTGTEIELVVPASSAYRSKCRTTPSTSIDRTTASGADGPEIDSCSELNRAWTEAEHRIGV